jgi:glycosyltransferase involved in cell wall biosynthesis
MPERSARFSLVMAALNSEHFIAAALRSVEEQDFSGGVEVVLADGGSRDATVEIATRYPFVRVLEGGDTGIYAAFNRGVRAARGEFVGFLNTDDMLLPGALARIAAALDAEPAALFASGDVLMGPLPEDSVERDQEEALSLEGALFGIPAINARFFRREAAGALLQFDETVGLAADKLAVCRMAMAGFAGVHVTEPVYFYRSHIESRTISGDAAGRIRILSAEIAICENLLADPGVERRHRRVVASHLALLKARLRLASGRPAAAAASLADPAAISGLRRWARWRGRLSGH